MSADENDVTENVKVVSRIRPFNRREYEIQDEMNSKLTEWERRPLRSVITMGKDVTRYMDWEHEYEIKEEFKFDVNLWSLPADQEQPEPGVQFCTQEIVFDKIGAPTISHAFNGFNNCIFAYGQTGSGKTHTMMGSTSDKGLTPRVCVALFEQIQNKQKEADEAEQDKYSFRYLVTGCYLEIYNEHVKDLLWQLADPATAGQYDKDNLKVRNTPNMGPYVVGLTTMPVQSWEECDAIINTGLQNRVTAATKMNDQSSRSHAVFRLTVRETMTVKPQKSFEKPKVYDKVALISLVDLAGSERLKKSGAQGQRLKEAAAINLSLTTLKNVIDALVEGRALIPYRDSQLTWLLSDSLGGNSKTFMIACLSPHYDNGEESLNTMRYALRTQGIQNKASVNQSDEGKKLQNLQKQLQDAQRAIAEGKDSEKNKLKREREEKETATKDLEKKADESQKHQGKLDHQIEEEKGRMTRAIYMGCFHTTLMRRSTQKLNRMRDDISSQNSLVLEDLAKIEADVNQLQADYNKTKEQEVTSKATLGRAQREFEKFTGLSEEGETALKKALNDSSSLDSKFRRARARYHYQALFNALRVVVARRKGNTEAEELAQKQAQELAAGARSFQTERTALLSAHERQLKRIESEMESLDAEYNETKQQIASTTDDRRNRIRRLNEDSTFFTRENRAIDDERVQRTTEMERTNTQRFQNESNRLSERSVKGRQFLEQKHQTVLLELERQFRQARIDHEAEVKRLEETWAQNEKKVKKSSDIALQNQAKHYREVIAGHDSQIDDAREFQHRWEQKSQMYINVYKDIQAYTKNANTVGDIELTQVIDLLEAENPQRKGALVFNTQSLGVPSASPTRGASTGNKTTSSSVAPSGKQGSVSSISATTISGMRNGRVGSRSSESMPSTVY